MAESMLLSGTPKLVASVSETERDLFVVYSCFLRKQFFPWPATRKRTQRLIVMCEEFKYQQGYFRALSSTVLNQTPCWTLLASTNSLVGRSPFSDNAVPSGGKAQHLPHVPTCTLRGVMEEHYAGSFGDDISPADETKWICSAIHRFTCLMPWDISLPNNNQRKIIRAKIRPWRHASVNGPTGTH
jgi:hypothetical protein